MQPRSGYECQENMQGFKTFEEKGYKNSPKKLFRCAASGQNQRRKFIFQKQLNLPPPPPPPVIGHNDTSGGDNTATADMDMEDPDDEDLPR